MKNFRTIEWLNNNKDREDLVIFDVRNILGDDMHIPNAILIPTEEILSGELREHGGRNPLPDINEFAQNMNNFGVDDESTVIVYDEGNLSIAGRLWWMLRYIGFREVYVLLGGFKAWKSKDYPLSADMPKIRKGKELTVNLQSNMIADINDVKKIIMNDAHVLIDSRTPDRYRGENEPVDKIAGHIPGAINMPWTELSEFYRDDIDETEIKEHYKDIKDYDKVAVYCGSGVTATVNILFMEEVGLLPQLYVGSYSDWISYPDNEISIEK